MSSNDQTLTSLALDLLFSFDGAVLGTFTAVAAVAAVAAFRRCKFFSSALSKIRHAPSVTVSDLRFLIPDDSDQTHPSDAAKLVVLRGHVQAKPGFAVLKSSAVVNLETNESTSINAVIVQKTQRLIYDEWRTLFGLSDLQGKLGKMFSPRETSTMNAVPFVLSESGISDFVVPKFEGVHPLPLVTISQQRQLFEPACTLLQGIFSYHHPIGLLDEEKVLPVGVEVSAVGLCSFQNGIGEIKSCSDLPYFLSLLDKDELVLDLESRSNVQFWIGVGLGLLSVGILCYASVRNWHKLKERRQEREQQQARQQQQASNAAVTISVLEIEAEGEEDGEVPEGQLCIICLTRRRRSAFIPCGHLVCCHRCCISVEQSRSPKCPVCRQEIRTAIRIYDS